MRLFLVLLLAVSVSGCGQKQWYKGNTHTHSFWSDGNDFPEMIALWYRDRGYDFLVLSDHNVLSRGERWIKLAEIERRRGTDALAKCAARLGDDWLEFRGEGEGREVRLRNLDEVRKLVHNEQFLMVEGEEITDRFKHHEVHTNAMNLAQVIPPPGGESVRELMRNAILAVQRQAREHKRPILPHLNHPNFRWSITAEDIAHVVEEEFFEVYNGHPGVGHTGDEYHAPVERLWDIANTLRIAELHAPPPYGVATDDSHHYHEGKTQTVTPGKGWIMVRAARLEPGRLIKAMRRGDFYASSGVTLSEVKYDGKSLTVRVAAEPGAQYTIEFIGTLRDYDRTVEPRQDDKGNPVTGHYSPDIGKVLMKVEGTSATYRLTGDELYVRAVVHSSQPPANPSFDGQVAQAWTQPVGWDKHVRRGAKHHHH